MVRGSIQSRIQRVSQPPDKTSSLEEPHRFSTCWKLRNESIGEATCELWSHPLGRELRLDVNGELIRSEVFRERLAWADVAVAWKRAMVAKGWQEPPAEERVPVV